jgi:hypothetical protein
MHARAGSDKHRYTYIYVIEYVAPNKLPPSLRLLSFTDDIRAHAYAHTHTQAHKNT